MRPVPASAGQVGCRPTCGVLREDLAERRVQRHITDRRRHLAIPHDAQSYSLKKIAGVVDALRRSGRGRRPRDRLQDGCRQLPGQLLGRLLGYLLRNLLRNGLAGRDLHGQPNAEQVLDDLVAALSGREPAAARNVRIPAEALIPGPAPCDH